MGKHKNIPNEELAREALTLVKRGRRIGLAVRDVFARHGLNKHAFFSPDRFGRVCRLVRRNNPEPPTEAPTHPESKRRPYY